MDNTVMIEEKVAGAGEVQEAPKLSNSFPQITFGRIGAALIEHFHKYPDVFKVIPRSKLPMRDDL